MQNFDFVIKMHSVNLRRPSESASKRTALFSHAQLAIANNCLLEEIVLTE